MIKTLISFPDGSVFVARCDQRQLEIPPGDN